MKKKQTITYIKNGKEYNKTFNPLNNTFILLALFHNAFFQDGHFDYYAIKESVSYLHLKNIQFYHDVKIKCPKDTILVLENCKFKEPNLYVIGGHVQIINPKMPKDYCRNNIYIADAKDFSLINNEVSNVPLFVSSISKKIYLENLNGEQRKLYLNLIGDKITLNNITNPKSLTITSKKTKILESNINVDDLLEYEKKPEEPSIDDIPEFRKLINPKEIQIETNQPKPSLLNLKTDELILNNSSITTFDNLKIDCQKITTDDNSTLQSNHDIILGNDIYKNNLAPNTMLVITPSYLKEQPQEKNSRKELISVLKGIKQQVTQEMITDVSTKVNKFIQKQNIPMPTKALIRKKIKNYEVGMSHNRKIGTYKNFYN